MAATFPLAVVLSAVDRITGPLDRVGGKLSKFASGAKAVGRGMTSGLTLPLALAGAATIGVAVNFDKSMNKVAALTGETGEGLDRMRDTAKKLGIETAFSAGQAADAMAFLGMAGFDVDQILTAVPDTLALAAAGTLDLATAADIASNVLTGYGLEAAQMGRVSNLLAKAQAATNTNVEQLGEALKLVGPVAAAMNIPLEETVQIAGALGNAGFQATLAGTAMRGALAKLAKPTREAQMALAALDIRRDDLLDGAGNVRSLVGAVELLERKGATAGDLLTIFGQRAGPAMAALVGQGSAGLADVAKRLDQAKDASQQAAIQLGGAVGSTARLKSAFEGLLISIAESGLLERFAELADRVAEWFRGVSDANPETLAFGVSIALAAAAIGPILLLLGSMASGVGLVTSVVSGLIPVMGTLWAIMAANPIGAILTLIALLLLAVPQIIKHWDKVSAFFSALWTGIMAVFKKAIGFVLGIVQDLVEALDFVPGFERIARGMQRTRDALAGVGEAPDLSASIAGSGVDAQAAQSSLEKDSTVRVLFDNLPEGARVQTEGNAIETDLGLATGLNPA